MCVYSGQPASTPWTSKSKDACHLKYNNFETVQDRIMSLVANERAAISL